MIFVDANFYLRYLAQPVTPQDRINQQRAGALFSRVVSGDVEVTTSEAVLAEVAFILTSPRHYGAPRGAAATGLSALLRPRSCRLPTKLVVLRALDLWVEHPELSFPDAIGAANSELFGHELATFDAALSRTPGVLLYSME